MSNTSEPVYQVVVTGYGPFMSIKKNPSDNLQQLIASQFSQRFGASSIRLLHSQMIPVEGPEVDKVIETIEKKVIENRMKRPDDRYLMVHLGNSMINLKASTRGSKGGRSIWRQGV